MFGITNRPLKHNQLQCMTLVYFHRRKTTHQMWYLDQQICSPGEFPLHFRANPEKLRNLGDSGYWMLIIIIHLKGFTLLFKEVNGGKCGGQYLSKSQCKLLKPPRIF